MTYNSEPYQNQTEGNLVSIPGIFNRVLGLFPF